MGRYVRTWIHWCRDLEEEGGGVRILAGGAVIRLNRSAGEIWEALEAVGGREELLTRMRRRWRGVVDRRLQSDLHRLLDEWEDHGWIGWIDDVVFPFPGEWWPV